MTVFSCRGVCDYSLLFDQRLKENILRFASSTAVLDLGRNSWGGPEPPKQNQNPKAQRCLLVMHQSIPAAPSPPIPPPPGLLRGICPPCQSWEWGICKFCAARGHSRAFDTHAVSYQNTTTQRIGSSVKDSKKLKRVVKACC